MRRLAFALIAATLVGGSAAGVARAAPPPLDQAGQPFYFSATCTGLGDVVRLRRHTRAGSMSWPSSADRSW